MTTPQKEQIFISYSRRDDAIMQRVVKFLRDKGLDVWVDNEKLVPGTPVWELELEKAIKRSIAVLVLLSPDSKESKWVTRELVVAERHEKRIFPILVRGDEDSSLHFRLSTHQYIDFRQKEARGLNELHKAIFDYFAFLRRVAEQEKLDEEQRKRQEQDTAEKRVKDATDKAAREKIVREVAAKARIERLAREKHEAEEKARLAALKKERQQERTEKLKKFFSRMGKLPLYVGGGFVLLFLLGYIISNIEIPETPAPTEIPSRATPTSIFLSTATLPPTKSLATPIPALGVGSTMISEKDGMVMVYVPAGEFQMGSEDGSKDEKPIHTVYLDAYWIDQTEVTNAMYAKCVADGVCDAPSSSKSYTRDMYYGNSEFDTYPVIYVSWEDAINYCEWADRRLPSEAQWEKAAGWDEDAKSQRIYPWGSEIDDTYANYNQNVGDTTAVGSYGSGKSFYGAYDMAGNLWEWVNDWYASAYYANSPTSNPLGPESGSSRVLRGGSWGNINNILRVANRNSSTPDGTYNLIGFRCSRSLP